MVEGEQRTGGVIDSLRRLAASILGLVQTRAELFAVEFQEEKLRALDLVIWLAFAVTLGMAGLLVGLGALALFLWRTTGYAGLIGLSLVTLAIAAGIVWWLRHRILNGPGPFTGTITEFRKDLECLHRPD